MYLAGVLAVLDPNLLLGRAPLSIVAKDETIDVPAVDGCTENSAHRQASRLHASHLHKKDAVWLGVVQPCYSTKATYQASLALERVSGEVGKMCTARSVIIQRPSQAFGL